MRQAVRIIAVTGGDTELNRQLFGTPKIDMVSGVSCGSDFDYVMCNLARDNDVAVEFAFIDLLQSYGRSRTMILSNMKRNAALVRKHGAPFTITSGALSKWDMRSPHDLSVFGRLLGFSDPAIRSALSDKLITDNEKKISGKKSGKHLEMV
jgi:ribonuclease P/MRP protein subunit RPP1